MQIAFETAPRVVGGGHDPRPRCGELLPGCCVGDGGRDEIGEVTDPRRGVGGRASGPDDPTMADPQRRPSATIGAPTPERLPGSGMSAAAEPGAFRWLSTRAARPVRNTVA